MHLSCSPNLSNRARACKLHGGYQERDNDILGVIMYMMGRPKDNKIAHSQSLSLSWQSRLPAAHQRGIERKVQAAFRKGGGSCLFWSAVTCASCWRSFLWPMLVPSRAVPLWQGAGYAGYAGRRQRLSLAHARAGDLLRVARRWVLLKLDEDVGHPKSFGLQNVNEVQQEHHTM